MATGISVDSVVVGVAGLSPPIGPLLLASAVGAESEGAAGAVESDGAELSAGGVLPTKSLIWLWTLLDSSAELIWPASAGGVALGALSPMTGFEAGELIGSLVGVLAAGSAGAGLSAGGVVGLVVGSSCIFFSLSWLLT